MNKVIICPDVHCRSFYKPVLNVKDKPVIFLGDYMDPYRWENTSDEQGIANLEEIIDFARNNYNVALLVGNHDVSFEWSYMGFERTYHEYYDELHRLYRDNTDLFHPIHKLQDTLFTHAGISNGWLNTLNHYLVDKGSDLIITEDNIVSYIEEEWNKELQYDTAEQCKWYPYLNSPIFWIGAARGGEERFGGPFWNDFYDEYCLPEGWIGFQIVGHTQGSVTGSIRTAEHLACLDSRAIFEYDLDTHEIELSALNENYEEIKKNLGEGYRTRLD